MLALTRRAGESVVIQGGITITVVKIKEGRVLLGIDAPKDILIDREEVSRMRVKTLPEESVQMEQTECSNEQTECSNERK